MLRPHFFRKTALVLAVISGAPALANDTLTTIYSAEHALYGAGYDIGRADGWIDGKLRTAIREYQSDAEALKVTGNLDAPTLKALGVNARSESVISGNPVPVRAQALAALRLEDPGPPQTAQRRITASAEVEAAVPTLPDAERRTPIEDHLSNEKQSDTDSISNASEVIEAEVVEAVEVVEVVAEAEPEAVEIVEIVTAPRPEQPVPEVATEQEPASTDEETVEETELVARLPTEPTAAGPVEAQAVASEPQAAAPRPQSSGGFFSSLFDFLFGWLV